MRGRLGMLGADFSSQALFPPHFLFLEKFLVLDFLSFNVERYERLHDTSPAFLKCVHINLVTDLFWSDVCA